MSAGDEPRFSAGVASLDGPRATRRRATAPPIELVVVAIPARNEEQRIAACLASIDNAARRWGGPVIAVVGADGCTDATAHLVATMPAMAMTLAVVEGTWRRPSSTRRAAVVHALALGGGRCASDRTWIANTDADGAVDSDWITRQVASADSGVDLVAGVVALDPEDTPVSLQASFAAHYQLLPGERRHVHAANLGIRASVYRAIGGWRASTAIGEEHHLVRAAVRSGATVSWADDLVVRTSGRTMGRVRGGFASVLSRLDRDVASVADSA
ncbi:MAG: glycosyltransferase [Ilumatobacteraceae bacterium]